MCICLLQPQHRILLARIRVTFDLYITLSVSIYLWWTFKLLPHLSCCDYTATNMSVQMSPQDPVSFFVVVFKILFIFRDRKGGRKRGREKFMRCFLPTPIQGPGLQHRYGRWLGIKGQPSFPLSHTGQGSGGTFLSFFLIIFHWLWYYSCANFSPFVPLQPASATPSGYPPTIVHVHGSGMQVFWLLHFLYCTLQPHGYTVTAICAY